MPQIMWPLFWIEKVHKTIWLMICIPNDVGKENFCSRYRALAIFNFLCFVVFAEDVVLPIDKFSDRTAAVGRIALDLVMAHRVVRTCRRAGPGGRRGRGGLYHLCQDFGLWFGGKHQGFVPGTMEQNQNGTCEQFWLKLSDSLVTYQHWFWLTLKMRHTYKILSSNINALISFGPLTMVYQPAPLTMDLSIDSSESL